MTQRWHVGLLLCLACAPIAGGCRNSDLVEAELRTRERELREMRTELTHAEWENDALNREVQGLRNGSGVAASPESASLTYTVRQISLGRGTGGYDEDGQPGDEALQIVLEPRDGDGHVIKAPGSLHVEAKEINAEGLKIPLSTWDIGPDALRRTWKSGLFTTGYVVVLPWQKWPSWEKLRLTVRFILPDGRVFEADKDVNIRGVPPAKRKANPPPEQQGPAVLDAPVAIPLSQDHGVNGQAKDKAWWRPPSEKARLMQASFSSEHTHEASLADAVELLHPIPLGREPGEPDYP